MSHDITTRQREAYEALHAHPQGPFIESAPAIFSPAAAAQDEGNGRSAVKRFGPQFLPTEYTNWTEEAGAHVETAYLGDWSPLAKVIVRGQDALAFLSQLGMNSLASFELGQIKHHIQLDQNGWIASEGILLRLGEHEFQYTAGSGDWLLWQFGLGTWNATVEDISPDLFIFGVQGPQSIHVLENVLGESLGDIRFNRSRPTRIGGVEVRILRAGISAELGYEIHGPADAANDVWRFIRDAGADFGLKQLGLPRSRFAHRGRHRDERPRLLPFGGGHTRCPVAVQAGRTRGQLHPDGRLHRLLPQADRTRLAGARRLHPRVHRA